MPIPHPPEIPRTDWVNEFAHVARGLWADVSLAHIHRVAHSRWVKEGKGDPGASARRWVHEAKKSAG